jgi:hypothetical protein
LKNKKIEIPLIHSDITGRSTVMAPDYQILVMNTVFKSGLTTEQITEVIERITQNIQKECPTIQQIFMVPVK